MRVFRNTGLAFAVLLAALLMMQGCAKLKQIRIVSCGVESVSLHGMRGVSAVLSVDVDNPAATVEMSDVEGTLYVGNDVLGSFSAGSFSLAGRGVSENSVPVDFTLDRSVSFMEIVALLRDLDLDSVTMDISFRAKVKGGVSKKMRFERIPASRLVSGNDIMDSLGGIRNFFIL
ncbi:MAG: LEA type 2 family protein [Bacteroidetes bacterium]|uniref:LEA type 2 family protein n=1 Tax=Candidatus Cryptobacteroides intestinigallinarum TaxID=2840767 RepID=A0A9D9HLZ7_9BACT|nr:LEA type 2 family protein [Candidatus Cryptobacteroides intestinigallinarum]